MPERRPVGFRRHGEATEAPERDASPSVEAEGAIELDDDQVSKLLPERPKRGHKGSFGKLLVVAGSLDYAGAALLVCRAAGRAGAGLVTLAVPESLQPLFAAKVVEATTMALPEDDVEEVEPDAALARILDHEHDAMVLGPGLRAGLATVELVRELISVPAEPTPAPIVLDAEALRSLATMDGWWNAVNRSAILTPHAGEFARLRAGSGNDPAADGDLTDDDAARAAAARSAAATWNQVVVLKGARTVIASPDGTVAVAPFENPAMASGGTGDVLSGTIGSLLAQGLAAFDAAKLGVYLHGMAGDTVRDRLGDAGLLASDLPDAIPGARKRLAGLAERNAGGKRLGFRAHEESQRATRPDRTAGAAGRRVAGCAERRTGELSILEPARVPIEARLAKAGLPPLPRTAWLELDLDALRSNLDSIRGLVGSGVRVEPVVKADAYGHGAAPIARALEAFGADGLCVATYDEAVELRAAGVRLPILVLFPIPPARGADAAARRISVSIGDSTQLERLVAAVEGSAQSSEPGSAGARGLDVHVEVETGLGRDGFTVEGIAAAARKISEVPKLHLAGLWTHMQDAADPARTAAQLDRFEAAAAAIRDAGIALPGRHAAASAGLLAGTVMAFDAVRPGLATYGLVPDELLGDGSQAAEAVPSGALPSGALPSGALPSLRPVMSLHARAIRVADLPSGWGISYGPTFETARASRIATLPLGYGDGWPRALSNRGDALVRGVRAPLVGNVAMDALMVDVTDVPGDPVSLDDEFVLLGRQGADEITAASLAATRGTISWEVVAAMSRRLPRVYHAASGPLEVRTLTAGGASS